MTGAYGDDLILYVPKGTLIRRADNHLLVADLTEDHQQVVLLEGGQGGKGNTRFRSSSNQAPREAQPGTPGEEGWFIFELKVMADIGLVGFPNAGKSTLIATVSEAKPKIADYPFTTLNPHLGVVPIGRWNSLVMADIPGLIEGAGQGAGLGFRFLKHIERTAALLFLIDASDPEAKPMARYQTLLNELGTYNPTLLEKQRCVALTKKDLVLETDSDTHQAIRECQEQLTEQHIPVFFISAFERPTLLPLLETLYDITRSVRSQRTQEEAEEPSPFPHTRCTGSDDPLDWLTLPQDP
jgi:GTP-binding protein